MRYCIHMAAPGRMRSDSYGSESDARIAMARLLVEARRYRRVQRAEPYTWIIMPSEYQHNQDMVTVTLELSS